MMRNNRFGWAASAALLACLTLAQAAPDTAPRPHPGWLAYESEHFTFYYAPDSTLTRPGAVEKFADGRERALAAVCDYLGVEPQGIIYFYAYDRNEVAVELIGRTLGFALPRQNIIHSLISQSPGHEVTHIVDYWFDPRGLPNDLLREGLAVFLNQAGQDALRGGRELLERDRLPSVMAMMATSAYGGLSYTAAGAFVSYLCQQYGFDRFQGFWGSGVRLADFRRTFAAIYGCTVEEMDAEWRDFLRQYGGANERQAPDVSPEERAAAAAEARAAYAQRWAQDRQRYTAEQLKAIDHLYGDQSGDGAARRQRLEQLVTLYPESNRAGCAAVYLAQMSAGEEQVRYLQLAIERHSNCFYGDGVQVGPFARYLLGSYYQANGRAEEARKLLDEIHGQYPRALARPGRDGTARLLIECFR